VAVAVAMVVWQWQWRGGRGAVVITHSATVLPLSASDACTRFPSLVSSMAVETAEGACGWSYVGWRWRQVRECAAMTACWTDASVIILA